MDSLVHQDVHQDRENQWTRFLPPVAWCRAIGDREAKKQVLSIKQNVPRRIKLLQKIKIKNVAGQHETAMLSTCGE